MTASKKLTLDFEPEADFQVLGLICFEKDFKLVWDINRVLKTDFIRVDDHKVKHRKYKTDQYFSCFFFREDEKYIDVRILSNKGEDGFLIGEVKNLDYLVVIGGEQTEQYTADFLKSLKTVESVESVFTIDITSLKEPYRLVFD